MKQKAIQSFSSVNSSRDSLDPDRIGDRQPCFSGLLVERRIFATPWHWCVHGLGIGQETSGFDASKSAQLLAISQTLTKTISSNYFLFIDRLLHGIVTVCHEKALKKENCNKVAYEQFDSAIERLRLLQDEPWQYPRACALLTESLVKLERLEFYRDILHWHLHKALEQLSTFNPTTDKLRYEKLQLLANLLLAAGQAEFSDLLVSKSNGRTYIDIALDVAINIDDLFYRGRGSAIIFTVIAIVGYGDRLYGCENHLQALLDAFDWELSNLSDKDSDGVHEGADYYIFPLSLILNAIAVLDCPEYLTYKRDWVQQTVSLFDSLSPASQASQITFLISALDNLGLLDIYVPEVKILFQQCIDKYLQSTDGFGIDDYLRCTYLIHLAYQLQQSPCLHPRIYLILSRSLAQTLDSKFYRESSYGSSYMVAAYILSAFDRSNRLNLLSSEPINLLQTISRFESSSYAVNTYAPRIAFALIETALRMRPLNTLDTSLFQNIGLAMTQ